VSVRDPPRTITIRGNSADLRGAGVKTRRKRAYDQTTVGEIVRDLAAEAGYTATVDPTLASQQIAHWYRMNESVMAAVTRLGRRYDAVATEKGAAPAIHSPRDRYYRQRIGDPGGDDPPERHDRVGGLLHRQKQISVCRGPLPRRGRR
jgi:hypothetical protein